MNNSSILNRFAMNPAAGAGAGSGYGGQHSEVISVPDRMVGLIIGKGGEQIANIQSESECRIQFAPDSFGMPERPCTLTGTAEAILKAKELIGQIMSKGHEMPPDMQSGSQTIEVMIPGNKAGIIIGKGGETIKHLQEQAGVRMVIIQENNSPTNYDKPLRITGDRASCQRAKELVMGLLAEKDMQLGGGSGSGGFGSEYGGGNAGGHRNSHDVPVPRSMIGIIIGKGGEMIKKIQQESGARIQFRPDDEQGGPNRMCNITGNQEQMTAAGNMIQEILERQGGGGSGGGGGGRVPDGIRNRMFGGEGGMDESTYSVPADKCGLVIGKGGETIREICRLSGAHVELNRDPSLNNQERVFRIQGSPDQTQTAIRLISEKAGIVLPRDGTTNVSNQVLGLGASIYGQQNAQQQAVQQLLQQQSVQQLLQQQQQQQQQQTQNYSSLQGWSNSIPYQQYTQQGSSADPNKQAVEAQQWAAAYFYGQQQQQQQATLQPVDQQQSPYTGALNRATISSPGSIIPQTGQADYSMQWVDYYRQQGMYQQAQAILQAAASSLHPQIT